jgi:hypothetical protein
VFIIAEVREAGATSVEVSQDIGGSACIVFVIAEVCEVGATSIRGESGY